MCGISIAFGYEKNAMKIDYEDFEKSLKEIAERGPDALGKIYLPERNIAIGHRRLSLIDITSAGTQPMIDDENGNIIVFNGEIYNYKELRSEMEKKGIKFKTKTDTEVIIKLYGEKGRSLLKDLRGMFSFVIYNNKEQSIFAARDPLGIKPLYYSIVNGQILIASQVKGLLQYAAIKKSPDAVGHLSFITWGSVREPRTLFAEIKSLKAGYQLTVARNDKLPRIEEYESVFEWIDEANNEKNNYDENELTEKMVEALKDSVKHHLTSDVPVGIFLSAGIDSSMLAAIACENNNKIKTLTLGVQEYKKTKDDETFLAKKIADIIGSQHFEKNISSKEVSNYFDLIIKKMDQPSIDGFNTYLISKEAKEIGLKAVISGVGADEIFGGYNSFRQIPIITNINKFINIKKKNREFIRNMIFDYFPRSLLKGKEYLIPRYSSILEYGDSYAGAYMLKRCVTIPWELESFDSTMPLSDSIGTMLSEYYEDTENNKDLKTPYQKVAYLELTNYMKNMLLRDSDWASMSHSVELRTPYVDKELIKATFTINSNHKNLKNLILKGINSEIYELISKRKKTGFKIPINPDKNTLNNPRILVKKIYTRYCEINNCKPVILV